MDNLIKLIGVEFKVFCKRIRIEVSLVKTLSMIPANNVIPPNTLYFADGKLVYFLDGGIACQVLP
jgi:hypothetical protein